MPTYPWLYTSKVDPDDVRASLVALSRVGTPYTQDDFDHTADKMKEEGDKIVANLATTKITAAWDDEIVALTAYLQRLGKDRARPVADAAPGGAK